MAYNKFGNRKVKTEEGTFDSEMEYTRWLHLKLLQQAGHITNLRRQVSYVFLHNNILIGTYKADAVYEEEGVEIVEDVKGVRTAVYQLKKKMMRAFHGITIREIGKEEMKVQRA